jgi:predicted NAD-dependent protein-ADP-ribosyltransferase YbiA (DUF1768 family)
MDAVLASKFQDPALLTLLLETGDEELCEVNEWHDQFWGVCSCPKHGGTGENNLGKALMRLRASLRDAL